MTNKEKFNIIYKHFAKPIADMKITYKNSPEFQELMNKFLTNQSDIDIILNSYDSSSTT